MNDKPRKITFDATPVRPKAPGSAPKPDPAASNAQAKPGAQAKAEPQPKPATFKSASPKVVKPARKLPVPPPPAPPAWRVWIDSLPDAGQTFETARGFVQRNTLALGIASAFVLTFALGILTAMMLSGGAAREEMALREGSVTRAVPTGLTSVPARPQEPAVLQISLTPDQTGSTLDGLRRVLDGQALDDLRDAVRSGDYAVAPSAAADGARIRLRSDVVAVDLLSDQLAQAVRADRIVLPAGLGSAGGGVDTDTLMFNIVQASLANDGTQTGAQAARDLSRAAFAASTATTVTEGGARLYTVKPGDSLAYIALQFYGRPDAFPRIFDANRDTLQSPDTLQTGQRLRIPS